MSRGAAVGSLLVFAFSLIGRIDLPMPEKTHGCSIAIHCWIRISFELFRRPAVTRFCAFIHATETAASFKKSAYNLARVVSGNRCLVKPGLKAHRISRDCGNCYRLWGSSAAWFDLVTDGLLYTAAVCA